MGQIGEPRREIYVEPLELPVRQREVTPTETPQPDAPVEVPA